MEDAVLVTKRDALAKLVHKAANRVRLESTTLTVRVHVALEILLAKFKDEDKLELGVNDVVQAHNIWVSKFFHQTNLTNRRRRRTLLCVEVDFLEGNDFVVRARSTL